MALGEAAGAAVFQTIEDRCPRVADVDPRRVQRTLVERHGAFLLPRR
jgi:hypothetical protein